MTKRFQSWVAIIFCIIGSTGLAEEKLWVGGVSTDWFEPGNWSPAGVPSVQDTAMVHSNVVILSSDVVIDGLVFTQGLIDGVGNLTVTNCSWSGGVISGSNTFLSPRVA